MKIEDFRNCEKSGNMHQVLDENEVVINALV